MSMRTMAVSSSNRKSASDLASSVLPTPVGPRNRNDPVGRFGSEIPARERRTASETAFTASRWPMSRSPSRSSMCSSFSDSPCSIRPTGIPVQAATTSAMSVSETSSETMREASASVFSASMSCCSMTGISPYSSCEARPRSPARCALSASTRSASIFSLRSPTRFSPDFSCSQRASRPRSFSWASASSERSAARRSRDAASSSFFRCSSCISIRSTSRRSMSISSGLESISIRSREAASSTRSMALSGSFRLVM